MFSPSSHLLLADTCTSMELHLARCHIHYGTCCRFVAPPVADDRMIMESRSLCACFSVLRPSLKVFRLSSPLKAFGFGSQSRAASQEVVLNVFNLPAGIFLAASRDYCAKLLPQMLLEWHKLLRVSPPVVDHWILVQSKTSWHSDWFDLAWTSSDFLSRPWPCMVSLTWSRKLIK